QGGTSLILRSAGHLVLRHDHRQAALGMEDVRHYAATIRTRSEFYDVSRMQDEVVLASVGDEVLLSHPQSDMWLNSDALGALVSAFFRVAASQPEGPLFGIPEWLKVSTGGGRLLLSDQRTARWVLLAEDHVFELDRRLATLRQTSQAAVGPAPVTIPVKGLKVHLQSAFRLSRALLDFARTGHVTPLEEITANFELKASPCTEGIELRSADERVTLTAREAPKWASIINSELERLSARQFDRGGIRTVFAATQGGCWVLQWGDEVFVWKGVPFERLSRSEALSDATGSLVGNHTDEFLLLLSPPTGACVALTESESQCLKDLQDSVA
ncbi:MAG TPA: hypothetical protein VLG74_12465, partial [Blastocatellia bacterium]|nr:hypothetical protein [Blastocatellia bacterium]